MSPSHAIGRRSLRTLDDDVAATRRVIDAQPGPVVVVGHSDGGAVVTGAAAGSPKVRALVYVAAYAPDVGETLLGLNERFALPPLASALAQDPAGFLTIDGTKLSHSREVTRFIEAAATAAAS